MPHSPSSPSPALLRLMLRRDRIRSRIAQLSSHILAELEGTGIAAIVAPALSTLPEMPLDDIAAKAPAPPATPLRHRRWWRMPPLLRKDVLKSIRQGHNARETARRFRLPPATVYNIVQAHKRDRAIAAANR